MGSVYFTIAFLCGMVPALFWLWFWLREDKKRPEPFYMIALSFVAGMLVVPLALPLQKYAIDLYSGTTLVFVWVVTEELLKYAVALVFILWNEAVDEPIDLIIYMITIALGFSALENTLYLFTPLSEGAVLQSVLMGNFRFLGATLLHVLASGTVGVALALVYYKKNMIKVAAGTLGLCMAVILHGLFNFFIMNASGETILIVFLFVWMGVILMFLLFEKVKLLELAHNQH